VLDADQSFTVPFVGQNDDHKKDEKEKRTVISQTKNEHTAKGLKPFPPGHGCSSSCACSMKQQKGDQDMAKRDTLKFATFNLYNLQLPQQPMYHGKKYTAAQYKAKLVWTARMLKDLDADIIAFQELWRPECLEAAFDEAGLQGEYTFAALDDNPSGIDNAVAVRKPHKILSKKWIKKFPDETVLKKRSGASNEPDYQMAIAIDRFSRSVLHVNVKVDIGPNVAPIKLIVLAAHLKSKLPIQLDSQESKKASIKRHATALGQAMASIRRTAEAAAVRVMLNKLMKGNDNPVVVLGDLNNTEDSVSTAIITGQPKFRLFADSKVGSKSDAGLYAASSMQGYRSLKDVAFTNIFDGRRETLDHILVSEQFYDYSKKRIWSFNNMRCFNDYLDDDDKSTSDHAAVRATFDYNPA
jgi:endonuclease/exonuclease/phosphatase family metal-dependent hydrolase